MATFTGSDGVILVGTDQIAEVRSYSIDETMDTLEDTAMGDTSRTYKTSLKSFSELVRTTVSQTEPRPVQVKPCSKPGVLLQRLLAEIMSSPMISKESPYRLFPTVST